MARGIPRAVEITLGLDEADDAAALRRRAARALGVGVDEVPVARVARRAIDARKGRVRFVLQLAFDAPPVREELGRPWPVAVTPPARVAIVGGGPAGLFCAYELARHGIAAVVLERGRSVRPRRLDLRRLNREGVVDPDSNYCFGEGGAGTYSDGKLYTRATKRGEVRDVLETLALHDAPMDILVDARPHIGSNRLPSVLTALRTRLEACGVGFRFGARVAALALVEGRVRGVRLADGDVVPAEAVVLATGHSARDVYHMLAAAGVRLAAKPVAVGVRIEHPQPLIDRLQYGASAGHTRLPAAAYRLAVQVEGRGVFSFCMCPGGFIVPAATTQDGLVVNGMSLKRRDSPYANAGLVVQVEVADAVAAGYTGPLALLEVQRRLEAAAAVAGGGALRAPAQRASDFTARRASSTVPASSYQPGLCAGDVATVLDAAGVALAARLRAALAAFAGRLPGYAGADAVLVGVETRTSAPVRIPRDPGTLMAPDVAGLYPCGEGAGYAGGIVSAALDGIRVARALTAAMPPRAGARRPAAPLSTWRGGAT